MLSFFTKMHSGFSQFVNWIKQTLCCSRGWTGKTRNLKKCPFFSGTIWCSLHLNNILLLDLFCSAWSTPVLVSKLIFLQFLIYLVVFTCKTGNWWWVVGLDMIYTKSDGLKSIIYLSKTPKKRIWSKNNDLNTVLSR